MKKIKQFEIEHLPIEELKPYRLNAKLHPQEQIKKIIRSIELTGFDQPIVVNKKDYSIVKGHGRLEAAIQMGMVTVPVIVLDVSQDVADKARLLDNKSAEGEYDIEKLLKELTRFQDDIDATGYGREELDKLLMELESQTVGIEVVESEEPTEDDSIKVDLGVGEGKKKDFDSEHEDDVPEEAEVETRVKTGDIWQLGNHFILCGDCTVERNVRELLGDKNIELLFTSPPYSDLRTYEDGTDVSIGKLSKIFSAWDDYVNFFVINLGLKFKDTEVVPYWQEWIDSAKKQGLKLLAWNVWDKTIGGSIASACNMFLLTHEWLFVFGESRKRLNRIVPNKLEEYKARHGDDVLEVGMKGKIVREKDGTMSTTKSFAYTHHQLHSVIQQTPELGSIRKDHPAIMPVGLPQQYIESMTDEGQIVSDCFLGSGTTLIACEKTNRVCYGSELSEKYSDVIVTRWEKLTGMTAVLVRNINK